MSFSPSMLVQSVSATGTRTMLHYSRTYDPAMPGEELYTTPVPLDPQSTIVTTCVYNSKNAVDEVTAWGQEDCLAVLYYMYPASDKSYGGSCFNTQGIRDTGSPKEMDGLDPHQDLYVRGDRGDTPSFSERVQGQGCRTVHGGQGARLRFLYSTRVG